MGHQKRLMHILTMIDTIFSCELVMKPCRLVSSVVICCREMNHVYLLLGAHYYFNRSVLYGIDMVFEFEAAWQFHLASSDHLQAIYVYRSCSCSSSDAISFTDVFHIIGYSECTHIELNCDFIVFILQSYILVTLNWPTHRSLSRLFQRDAHRVDRKGWKKKVWCCQKEGKEEE